MCSRLLEAGSRRRLCRGSHPNAPKYQDVPPTTADLDYADLVTLDLELFDTDDGKQQLASQLRTAISTVGFFYVTNFGLPPEKVDEQFAIAQDLFNMPHSKKLKYRVDHSKQGFFGWRPKGNRKAQFGLKDNLELYDDSKYNATHGSVERPAELAEKRK